jgi:hypothetical protein
MPLAVLVLSVFALADAAPKGSGGSAAEND